MKTAIILLVLIFFGITSNAQDAILKVGHLINPINGSVSENKIIEIENGKIKAISDYSNLNENTEYIDLSNSWVSPGLIDCHVHLTLNLGYGQFDIYRNYLEDSNSYRALIGAENARALLHGGFTTIKEIGSDGDYITSSIIRAINDNIIEGPKIIYAGKIIAPYGGQLKNIKPSQEGFWNYEFIDADSQDEIKKAIRKNIYHGANCIKLVSGDQNYFYSKEDVAFAVDQARMSGLKLTVHALNDDAAIAAILGGAAAIEHGLYLSDKTLRLMKEKGTFLVGTDLSFNNWLAYGMSQKEAENMYQITLRRLKSAYNNDVKMAFGTDVIINLKNKNRLESNYEILKTWNDAKIPALKTLQSLTSAAAELLGIENGVGKIDVGYEADIVAFSENPLDTIENISTVHFVMKSGVIHRGN